MPMHSLRGCLYDDTFPGPGRTIDEETERVVRLWDCEFAGSARKIVQQLDESLLVREKKGGKGLGIV